MSLFKATITLTVAEINPALVREHPRHYARWFKNPAEPTETEFRAYAEAMLEDMGTSNSGSECIMNARINYNNTP